ncbi:MAG: class I SAM-dependent rRNA methyltransferase [Lachnospiraceae bacterium]|nr:class I SAM-dependent rRNA methyltransferase [Lachnospiraceae bacterium]
MHDCKVILKKGEGRTLKAGGAWVFDNEIASIQGIFENGDIVSVHDFDDYFMGYGFINTNSKITVRILSRKRDTPVTPGLLKMRVQNAWNYRKDVLADAIEESGLAALSCRILFGEADFLPGITVDKFSDVLVVESLALGIDRMKGEILADLIEVLAADGVTIRGVYERSDAKERDKEGLPRIKGFLPLMPSDLRAQASVDSEKIVRFDTKVEIVENGVHYFVDVADGQKTGFFLDQKYNRKAMQKLCKGKTVLDCFTHTGSFALNAGIAGASTVLGVDASDLGIAQADENAKLNHLENTVSFQVADVFDLLPRLEEQGKQFDVVILDPPAFTKSRNSVKNAVKGYREINLRGMKLVKEGGYLATCSCSHFMEPALFAKTIAEAARGAHKKLRQVEFRTQCADHPILWANDASYYLKFYIFQVINDR